MAASSLLLDDDDDINDANLQDFYVSNIPFLKKIPIYEVDCILSKIGLMYHSTLQSDLEWRYFAYDLGLEDSLYLYKMERRAKNINETPLYISLHSVLQHDKTFGHIVEVLLKRRRLDILTEIKSFVEGLLKRKSTKVKSVVSVEQFSESGSEVSENTLETVCDMNSLKTESEFSSEIDTIEMEEKSKCEHFELCKNSVITQEEEKLSNCKSFSMEISTISPVPPENSLIVLIHCTEHEWSTAQKLSKALREASIIVKILSDFDHLLMMDSLGALRAIVQEVDFIVPIVSQEFVEQVSPCINEQCHETSDATNNRCLYKLYTNEFIRKKCINIKVKPVLVPKLAREKIQDDLILCKSLRLWEEVPKLISVLKKTKEVIAKYPLH